ncbi:NACHT domain-containing NTPase [Rubrivivax sp. JA1026]|uniref:NACHT domain-containing protein n=1 Tax=Rubrivivax sp. JA1026 TaxID=2710888 RepID=UPI0013E98D26|nr:NACHT domain-containing protein [Rubrivivax sp. JA1026]
MATGTEAIAFDVTKAAVSALVKPVLTLAFSGFKSLTQSAVASFGDRFSEYISQQAIRHSKLSTIVFGHQKSLEELYIPLTVVVASPAEPRDSREEVRIDRFQTAFLPAERRVLITDTAGMGKSTLSKFLFLQCLKSCYAIPVFVELRNLSEKNTITASIQRQLNNLPVTEDEPRFTRRQVEKLFSKGGLVFFFDGFDEIPFRDREAITKDLKDFVEKYPDNTYIITSRPETGLLAFPAFRHFNIRPLRKEESFELIRKYDLNGGRSEQLIQKLKGRDYAAVQEFLKNPLLTSLLYRSFEYKQNVPIKKHIFYRQVYDALFDWHDATKDGYNTREKRSGLDIDTFHRVLRVVGFVSVMKGEIEGSTDNVLGWIRKARTICVGAQFSESSFLDDLVRAVPIFAKEGEIYRWSHKSLAEYFAAQYICTEGKSQQASILGAFLSTGSIGRFSNVLDQVYDLDIAAFRQHLLLPTARAFSVFWNSTYQKPDPAISASAIAARKELLFDRQVALFPTEILNKGDFVGKVLPLLRQSDMSVLPPGDTSLGLYMYDAREDVVVGVGLGSYAVVLDILRSKKDPIVRRFPRESEARSNAHYRFPKISEPYLITDDPAAEYNKALNFGRFTNSLARFPHLHFVDSDQLLQFEASFRDIDRLSELADELIRPLGTPGRGN